MSIPISKDIATEPIDPTSACNDDLPAPEGDRWTPRRKAAVVAAVNAGKLTVEEACDRYCMSLDEFSAWDRALHNFGIIGRG